MKGSASSPVKKKSVFFNPESQAEDEHQTNFIKEHRHSKTTRTLEESELLEIEMGDGAGDEDQQARTMELHCQRLLAAHGVDDQRLEELLGSACVSRFHSHCSAMQDFISAQAIGRAQAEAQRARRGMDWDEDDSDMEVEAISPRLEAKRPTSGKERMSQAGASRQSSHSRASSLARASMTDRAFSKDRRSLAGSQSDHEAKSRGDSEDGSKSRSSIAGGPFKSRPSSLRPSLPALPRGMGRLASKLRGTRSVAQPLPQIGDG